MPTGSFLSFGLWLIAGVTEKPGESRAVPRKGTNPALDMAATAARPPLPRAAVSRAVRVRGRLGGGTSWEDRMRSYSGSVSNKGRYTGDPYRAEINPNR